MCAGSVIIKGKRSRDSVIVRIVLKPFTHECWLDGSSVKFGCAVDALSEFTATMNCDMVTSSKMSADAMIEVPYSELLADDIIFVVLQARVTNGGYITS